MASSRLKCCSRSGFLILLAFSRVDTLEEERIAFIVYMDEFHNFTTLSLVNMFSELRKFKVEMTLAHQYMHQIDDDIKRAVVGNVGTIISFRLGTEDALHMSREMYPEFDIEDFVNLPNYHMYLKLMIDGKPSRPFSASPLAPRQILENVRFEIGAKSCAKITILILINYRYKFSKICFQ